MANCSDNVYVIKYTDQSKGTITITKSSLVTDLVDIALVGKSRLDYGEVFNENVLHLLENFACPALSTDIHSPDTLVAFGTLLSNPLAGQKWYNSTNKRLYTYNGTLLTWTPTASQGDVAGNSGVIAHGEFLPRPVGLDGYVFPYSECSFVVSQHSIKSVETSINLPLNSEIDYMNCFVASNGQVTMQFRFRGESTLRAGYVNYQIIGIRDESNAPFINVTPYPVPSATPGASPTPTPTNTPTPTPTSSVQMTPTRTPAATVSPTPTRTPTPTPSVSHSRTPTPTPTPTPSSVFSVNISTVPTQLASNSPGIVSSCYITFRPDGTWLVDENTTGTLDGHTGVYLPSGIGNNYELMFTQATGAGWVGGVAPSPSEDGTYVQNVWYSLGSSIQLGVSDGKTTSHSQTLITVSIRRKANHADTRSTSISFIATQDGGGSL